MVPQSPDPSSSVVLLEGDCLELAGSVPGGPVDLVYLDPPFATGRTHSGRDGRSFQDHWQTPADWVEFIRPRLREVVRLLAPTGAILFHCDWRTCHHARLMLEELLGADCFQNHLVWKYGLGGSSARRFSRKHDDILFFTRSASEWYFDPPMVPATSNRMKGMMKKATDVLDVPSINNMSRERNGWPTQKPLALLELLVGACCPPGGLVLDPMCGSGTTLEAARNLQRRAVGIDRLPAALEVAGRRLDTEVSDRPSSNLRQELEQLEAPGRRGERASG